MKIRGGKFFILAIIFSASFLFFSKSVESEDVGVVITEIGSYEQENYEWLEIYNWSENVIDLTGWKFWEGESNHNLSLVCGNDLSIESGEYAIIAENAEVFMTEYPFVTTTIFDSSWGTLNESGEEIGLKKSVDEFVEKFTYVSAENFSLERKDFSLNDYSSANWIEHPFLNSVGRRNYWADNDLIIPEPLPENLLPVAIIVASSSSFLGEKIIFSASSSYDFDGSIVDYSWNFNEEILSGIEVEKIFNATGTFFVFLSVTDDDGATASTSMNLEIIESSTTSENEIIATTTNKIFINEFQSDVTDEKEWIELFNSSTTDIDLNGWTISDGVGVFANLVGVVSSSSYFVFEIPSNKLNNSGDIIILKNSIGEIMDQVTYGDWDDGNITDNALAPKNLNSLARLIDGNDTNNDKLDFAETTILTKGCANVIVRPIIPVSQSSSGSNSSGIGNNYQPPNNIINFQPHDLVINELVSDPQTNEEEFVELFNNTNSTIVLDDWRLEDGSNSKTFLSGTILSRGFFVVEKPKGNLNNDGDIIKLFSSTGIEIDKVVYGDWDKEKSINNAPNPTESLSLARKIDGYDTDNNFNDFSLTTIITKNKANVISLPVLKTEIKIEDETKKFSTTTQDNIIVEEDKACDLKSIDKIEFSEIFPNPMETEAGEFIEVFNSTDEEINLSNCQLDDQDGGSKPYIFPIKTKILAGQFLVFYRYDTKIVLNNDIDQVRLLDSEGKIIKKMEIEKSQEGKSLAKNEEGDWLLTDTITPGKKNEFKNSLTSQNQTPIKKIAGVKISNKSFITNLEKIKFAEVGDLARVTGTVAVKPNVFGSQYFYIVGFSGAQVYMYNKDFPVLEIGDNVEVSGEISVVKGEKRIKVKKSEDIKKISGGNEPVPLVIEISEIDNDKFGFLVKVKGEITELKSSYLYLDDGNDEIRVYFKKGANIGKKNLKVGGLTEVIGIVQPFGESYQILPRSQNDLTSTEENIETFVEEEKNFGTTKETAKIYLAVTAGGLTSILLAFLIKTKYILILKTIKNIIGLKK